MRRDYPKLRLRSLLLLIAVVALALGFEVNRRRWARFRVLARYHAELEEGGLWTGRQCLDNVVEYEQRRLRYVEQGNTKGAQICVENSAPFAEEARRQIQRADYHARMKHYYASLW